MLINSTVFWIFFIILLIPYFTLLKDTARGQNIVILFASYFFYGWADLRMLPLLAIVTLVFYIIGIYIYRKLERSPAKASLLTTIGVLIGIGVLFYFKYLGFCIEQFSLLFNSIGLKTTHSTFNVIMPIGVSFFIFKLISYVIEIHRKNIEPCYDILQFASYVAFFPTIMSGPIDRPQEFIPQLKINHQPNLQNLTEGLKRVLWGLFTKCCIADTFSFYTNNVFDNIISHNTTTIVLAASLFTIQLYADFSGYSNMAIGVAQVMGFKVRENFNRPYFSKNMAEFWRRWHMSLTSWITDYIFMPLNIKLRDYGKTGLYSATLINLFVIGIWHGANWTFAIFGIYNALLLIICMEIDKPRKQFEKKYKLKNNQAYQLSRILVTLLAWIIAGIFFRSNNITDIITIFSSFDNFGRPFQAREGSTIFLLFGFISAAILFIKEYYDEHNRNIRFLHSSNIIKSTASTVFLIVYILLLGELEGGDFIYFKF